MGKERDMNSFKKRTAALIMAGSMAAGGALAPMVALAAQTSTGNTSVYVQLKGGNNEVGGIDDKPYVDPDGKPTDKPYTDKDGNPADDAKDDEGNDNKPNDPNPNYDPTKTPTNPDSDNDGKGDNIAFTVPVAINFTADASGNLTGPSADATYIQNESVFGIQASSFQVSAESGWTIIGKNATATADNSVDFQFGPEADKLDAADYITKNTVHTPSAWNMAANNGKVELTTAGKLHNLKADISEQTKIATIRTYVKPQAAATSGD